MSAMTSLDWPVTRAVLYRLSFVLGIVAWVAIAIMAWREPCPTGDGNPYAYGQDPSESWVH
jgi:hypothetical protein